jgi:hypothetical protein
MGVVFSGFAAPLYRPLLQKQCEDAFLVGLANLKNQVELNVGDKGTKYPLTAM